MNLSSLDFRRVRRDCGHNTDPKTPASRIIYDFEVVLDGEVRAVWTRNYRSTGYELLDTNEEAVLTRAPNQNEAYSQRHLYATADKKDDFVAITTELFLAQRIPTAAEALQYLEGLGRAVREAQDVKRAEMRKNVAVRKLPELLALVQAVADDRTDTKVSFFRAQRLLNDIAGEAFRRSNDEEEHYPLDRREARAVAAFKESLARLGV